MVRPACRQAGREVVEYFVYIIKSSSKDKFYTGMTSDIDRRLVEHNRKLSNTPTTKNTTDYNLVFCQVVEGRINARKLEKFLKSGFGREIRSEIVK